RLPRIVVFNVFDTCEATSVKRFLYVAWWIRLLWIRLT
ncbi:MAG: hypothetical protein ACJARF_000685, partial [Alteromonadaceae bacterium]